MDWVAYWEGRSYCLSPSYKVLQATVEESYQVHEDITFFTLAVC